MPGKSNRKKPAKPSPTFPLYAHNEGQWAKKIGGKFYYFGPWADPAAAEARYLREVQFIRHGVAPPPAELAGLTVRDVCNHYLTAQERRLEIGDIGAKHFKDLQATAVLMVEVLGRDRVVGTLTPQDFARLRERLARDYSPSRQTNEIVRTKSFFRWAEAEGLLEKPIAYGANFKGPSKRAQRLHRASRPARFFTVDELRAILAAAKHPLRAMILLAVNGGLGNDDVSKLRIESVDLGTGWLDYPRPKTGIHRRIPLWAETVAAVQDVAAGRTTGVLFRTKQHNDWRPETVSQRFTVLLERLDLKKPGVSFYALRHVAETIGGECKDQVAVDAVLGHVDDSMAATYREGVSDDRLRAVTAAIHNWLFADGWQLP